MAKRAVSEGAGPDQVETHQLARQGDALLERVERACGIYQGLLATRDEERGRR